MYRYAEKNIKFKLHSSWICVGGEKVGFTLINPKETAGERLVPPPLLYLFRYCLPISLLMFTGVFFKGSFTSTIKVEGVKPFSHAA